MGGSVARVTATRTDRTVEVFADIACPFAHVGLRRFVELRAECGRIAPLLRVRAWPLELVNDVALDGPGLAPKVAALRAVVAPTRFAGFDPARFPATTLPALAAEAAAYRLGVDAGEAFSLAVRDALFEDGADIADPAVIRELCRAQGTPQPGPADDVAVRDDRRAGAGRGVVGSPHFFTEDGDFFCPSLDIHHEGDAYDVRFDGEGLERFAASVFG